MKIFIGSDHRGFPLKEQLKTWLKEEGHEVEDCGNTKFDPMDDYPDFAKCVAEKVQSAIEQSAQGLPGGSRRDSPGVAGENKLDQSEQLGIVICGSGVGVSVMANRYKGIICALGFDVTQAKHARQNDHANVLSIPSDYVNFEKAKEIITAFLGATPKLDEKYLRRAKKLDE